MAKIIKFFLNSGFPGCHGTRYILVRPIWLKIIGSKHKHFTRSIRQITYVFRDGTQHTRWHSQHAHACVHVSESACGCACMRVRVRVRTSNSRKPSLRQGGARWRGRWWLRRVETHSWRKLTFLGKNQNYQTKQEDLEDRCNWRRTRRRTRWKIN